MLFCFGCWFENEGHRPRRSRARILGKRWDAVPMTCERHISMARQSINMKENEDGTWRIIPKIDNEMCEPF